jgi:hypothetical protein
MRRRPCANQQASTVLPYFLKRILIRQIHFVSFSFTSPSAAHRDASAGLAAGGHRVDPPRFDVLRTSAPRLLPFLAFLRPAPAPLRPAGLESGRLIKLRRQRRPIVFVWFVVIVGELGRGGRQPRAREPFGCDVAGGGVGGGHGARSHAVPSGPLRRRPAADRPSRHEFLGHAPRARAFPRIFFFFSSQFYKMN